MTTTISPDDYCKHPEDYKNFPGIDDTTRAYWDQYCQLKKQASQQSLPDSKAIGNAIPEALQEFIQGFLTPMNLEIMGGILGGPIVYKYLIKNVIGTGVKWALTKGELDAASAFIKAGGDEYIANSCSVLSKLFGNMAFVDLKVAEGAEFSGGAYAVARVFAFLGDLVETVADALNPIMDAMLVLQVLGMVFDAWDPCKLNVQLTAEQLKEFSNIYNNQFRIHVLSSLESTIDAYGHITLNSVWPIEYYAERSALIPFKNDYYDPIRNTLFMKYINSLRVNSDGIPIAHYSGGRLITNKELSELQISTLNLFGHGNTVIENWLLKWWPLLIGIILFLLIIFIVIKNKKNA